MRRIIEDRLTRWKNSTNKKPLIVRGARQVGKTYTVEKFGRTAYEEFFSFDFERDKRLHRIFVGDLDPRRILAELEVEAGRRIVPERALVLFDEIQACPEAVVSLRYFHEELPELHLIAAGSLLELTLGDISFPVGRVQFEWMRPLSFSEFLEGTGFSLLGNQLPCLADEFDMSESVHGKLLEQLRRYFIVGGMPEAVTRYAETGSFDEVVEVHRALALAYHQSFVKYHRRANVPVLENLLEQIPGQVGRQIKYSRLDPHHHTETVKTALRVLERALVVTRVRCSGAQGLPLGAGTRSKVFKVVFLDIGLTQQLSGVDVAEILHAGDLLGVYRGALAEQFVGQELLANGPGSENDGLFYWARARKNSNAEVDYLMARNGRIYPIEVKAGPKGRLRSLALFLEKHPETGPGLVLSPTARRKKLEDNVLFLPIYTRLS